METMRGVALRGDLAADMADACEKAGCRKYADGLRDGSMVPLVPRSGMDKIWAPGELFLKS